jgi:hypothetical protein
MEVLVMNNRRKQSISKKGRRCWGSRMRIWRGAQDQVDERDARQFAREANRCEAAAVSTYGMAAYDREDIRRDERGRILR